MSNPRPGEDFKTTAIALLAVIVLVLGASLVRVENQRYALVIGLCRHGNTVADPDCLAKVETRTSWLWHIWYGVTETFRPNR